MCPVYTDRKTKRLYIQFQYKGVTYKERFPAGKSKAEAANDETVWRNALLSGQSKSQGMAFEQFLLDIYGPHVESHYVDGDYKRAIVMTKAALDVLRGKQMKAIIPADIDKILSTRKLVLKKNGEPRKPATLVREMAFVSKMFSLAVDNRKCDFNPCEAVEKPKFDNVQHTILADDDEDRFFAAFESDWAKDVCKVILNTGLRQKDVLGLTKFNINWTTGDIVVLQGKVTRQVIIPMNETVQAIIKARWRNGSNLIFPSPKTGKQGKSIRKATQSAARRAGIQIKIGSQIARRTFGTRLHELGYDDSTVAQLLGHADMRSIHRYKRGTKIKKQAVFELESAKNLPTAKSKEG